MFVLSIISKYNCEYRIFQSVKVVTYACHQGAVKYFLIIYRLKKKNFL